MSVIGPVCKISQTDNIRSSKYNDDFKPKKTIRLAIERVSLIASTGSS